jgi:hypothetical protein
MRILTIKLANSSKSCPILQLEAAASNMLWQLGSSFQSREMVAIPDGNSRCPQLENADVDDLASAEQQPEGMMEWLTAPVKQAAQRGMLMFAFYQARLPMRIKSVLQQVGRRPGSLQCVFSVSVSFPVS